VVVVVINFTEKHDKNLKTGSGGSSRSSSRLCFWMLCCIIVVPSQVYMLLYDVVVAAPLLYDVVVVEELKKIACSCLINLFICYLLVIIMRIFNINKTLKSSNESGKVRHPGPAVYRMYYVYTTGPGPPNPVSLDAHDIVCI